jgi:hypothetical protein
VESSALRDTVLVGNLLHRQATISPMGDYVLAGRKFLLDVVEQDGDLVGLE